VVAHSSLLADKSLEQLQDSSVVGSCPEEEQDSFAVDKSLEEEEDSSAVAEHLVEVQDKSVVALPAAVDMLQHNVHNTTLYLAHITTDWTHFYQTL